MLGYGPLPGMSTDGMFMVDAAVLITVPMVAALGMDPVRYGVSIVLMCKGG